MNHEIKDKGALGIGQLNWTNQSAIPIKNTSMLSEDFKKTALFVNVIK